MNQILYIERWGINKAILPTMFAQEVALAADACYEACRAVRMRDNWGGVAVIESAQGWHRLYTRRRKVLAGSGARWAWGLERNSFPRFHQAGITSASGSEVFAFSFATFHDSVLSDTRFARLPTR